MPRTTISLGAILVIMGVIAYIATGFASWTALIPAILGVILGIFGFIEFNNAKVGGILALIVSVLGILGTFMNVLELGDLFAGEAERPAAVITSTLTFILLVIYVIMSIRSMVAGSKRRGVEA